MSSHAGTLQMLGCIDRTPSPGLDATVTPHRLSSIIPAKPDRTTAADQEQELKTLRVSHTHTDNCLLNI